MDFWLLEARYIWADSLLLIYFIEHGADCSIGDIKKFYIQ